MAEIREWFNALPPITRYWFGGSVALPLLGRLGVLPIQLCILNSQFISNFHLWRPITALFFYPLNGRTGFHFLTNLFFLYQYSIRLENEEFRGKPADYLFMLTFNWVTITIFSYLMSVPLLMDSMVMSALYVWCQFNKDVIVSFWFGTKFKAQYLPWILLGFNMILGGGGILEIIGIITGHLFYFLKFIYPETSGTSLLETPQIFYDYLPNVHLTGGINRFFSSNRPASSPSSSSSTTRSRFGGGHSWGAGNVLGRD